LSLLLRFGHNCFLGFDKGNRFVKCVVVLDPYATLRSQVKELFAENSSRYGYRWIHTIKRGGLIVSEKIIRRIMNVENLVIPYKKKRRYNSYKGR
jgi:transposase InsO family protein